MPPPDWGDRGNGNAGQSDNNDDDLIRVWSPAVGFKAAHNKAIDVSGGIALKAARGALVASHGIDVTFVNGFHAARALHACLGRLGVRGTRVVVAAPGCCSCGRGRFGGSASETTTSCDPIPGPGSVGTSRCTSACRGRL